MVQFRAQIKIVELVGSCSCMSARILVYGGFCRRLPDIEGIGKTVMYNRVFISYESIYLFIYLFK